MSIYKRIDHLNNGILKDLQKHRKHSLYIYITIFVLLLCTFTHVTGEWKTIVHTIGNENMLQTDKHSRNVEFLSNETASITE